MLPLLAGLNLACAWLMGRLARSFRTPPPAGSPPMGTAPARSGLRVLAGTRYLRDLAAPVLLGTVAAMFVGQAFMTHVKASLGPGPNLGSFSPYYAALSLLSFVSRRADRATSPRNSAWRAAVFLRSRFPSAARPRSSCPA